jgi:hypothetical protein
MDFLVGVTDSSNDLRQGGVELSTLAVDSPSKVDLPQKLGAFQYISLAERAQDGELSSDLLLQ